MANRPFELASLIIRFSMAALGVPYLGNCLNFHSDHPQESKYRDVLGNDDAIASPAVGRPKPAVLGS
jgi:hypothetical protein